MSSVARVLDLTDRRVQQLAKQGVIPRATRGRYDLVACVRGYVQWLRGQLEEGNLGLAQNRDAVAAESARLKRAQAETAEMELSQRRGELVPADQIEAALTSVLSGVRTRVLAVASRAAPRIHGSTSIADAESVLRKHLTEALEEIADGKVDLG